MYLNLKYTSYFLFVCLFLLLTGYLNAQQRFQDDLSVFSNYHYGYVLPEYENLTYVVNEPVHGFGFELEKQTRGNTIWEQIYNYPAFGIAAFYTTLGNNQVNGKEFALYPYYCLNIFATERFRFFHRIGVGFSYVNRKFDEKDNLLNVTTGSHLNLHFNSKIGFKYLFNQHTWLNGGLSFDHFSNGNLQEPNLGINSVTIYAGAGYLFGQQRANKSREQTPHERDYQFEFVYSAGGKHARALADEVFFTSSLTAEWKYKPFRVLHFGIGGDWFYDASAKTEMELLHNGGYKKKYDYRTGIHFSQELVYNRLSLILQEGFYLGLVDEVTHQKMYNRGMVRYRISEHFFVSIAMKSHLHILDYAEIGVGYIVL